MAWSLGSYMRADEVEKLVAANDGVYPADVKRFFDREQTLLIIHAALSGYGSRESGTAGCYAFVNLMEALKIKHWSFRDDWSDIHVNGAVVMQMLKKAEAEIERLKAIKGEPS